MIRTTQTLKLALLSACFHCALPAATILVTGSSDPDASGQQLQVAVNSAQPGDTILVSPTVYTGPIFLPYKLNPNGLPITIKSAAPAVNLPGPGVRTGPEYSAFLPQITGQKGQGSIQTMTAASYYTLINLELRGQSPSAVIYNMVTLGSSNADQTTYDAVPQHLIIDRCYIHGFPNVNFKQGIQINSGDTQIINNYISEFHSDQQDSQGVSGFSGPGPFYIVNNYIESAGTNILFGGGTPAINGLIPSNIFIAKNDFMKLLSYKNWTKVDPQTYAAITQADPQRAIYFSGKLIPNYVYTTLGAYTPNVKNMIEFKNGQDAIIIGNTFTNTYVQADQFGDPIAIRPTTEAGQATWATVQRINISNNIFRHQGGVALVANSEPGQTGPNTNNITFYNNLFDDLRTDYALDYERLIESYNVTNLRFDHNTMLNNNQYFTQVGVAPTTNFIYTDNIAVYGAGFSSYCGMNASAYACSFNSYSLLKNIFIGGDPAGFSGLTVNYQYFPSSINAVGFVDPNNLSADYHNYALAPSSPYKGKGLHGGDIGFLPGAYDYARAAF